MKWMDFKKKVESLGYDDNTEIRLFVTTECGDSYELNVLDIEDFDRQSGYGNQIDLELSAPPKEYIEYMNHSDVEKVLEELASIMSKFISKYRYS